jgi:oxygen-independent coproporphyrinogen III oxidase
MMNKIKTGVYIHIPFCKSRCYYCDFITFDKKESEFLSYTDALLLEIKNNKTIKEVEIETIFIGGGTPTVLPIKYLIKIINQICKYNMSSNIEITVEANPGTLTKEYLFELYNAGVNRLSIGLQAWQNSHLKNIGRIHTDKMFEENYNLATRTGFKNINVDIMFSLPSLTLQQWKQTLEVVTTFEPTHISAYSLIIEENTKFENLLKSGNIIETDQKIDREMYKMAKEVLNLKGYMQYEISNFAKPGMESRHNIDCWNRKNYIGFGLNAHSFFEGVRYKNTNDLQKYTRNSYDINLIREEVEVIDITSSIEEFMFLGLRLTEGINTLNFKNNFGHDIFDIYEKEINKFIKEKMLIKEKDKIFLSSKGLDLANEVFKEFIKD